MDTVIPKKQLPLNYTHLNNASTAILTVTGAVKRSNDLIEQDVTTDALETGK